MTPLATLVKARKVFLGANKESKLSPQGKQAQEQISRLLIEQKEYAPAVRSLATRLSVPERVAWAVILAQRYHEKGILENLDMIEADLTSVSRLRARKRSWQEALREFHPLSEKVWKLIDENLLRNRTAPEKARLYEDRLEDTPFKDILKTGKPFTFNSIITVEGAKGVKSHSAITMMKYAQPKDNGEFMSFIFAHAGDNEGWDSFVRGFDPDDDSSEPIMGSIKLENGFVLVEINGREMSYSSALNRYPELKMVVETSLRKMRLLEGMEERLSQQRDQPAPAVSRRRGWDMSP